MNLVTHAELRLMSIATREVDRNDPVAVADRATSLCDARIALALARGVPARYIDPASGGDFSPRAYRMVRQSWVRHLRMWPGNRAAVERGVDLWLKHAPHVVAAVEAVDPLTAPFTTTAPEVGA